MKKFVVMMGVLLCANCQSMDSGGVSCQRLGGVWNDILRIEKPGNYCLTGRVGSSEENGLTYMMKINRPSIGAQILASDVSLDLGGNVVGSSRVKALVLGTDNFRNPVDVGNITIRNGYITSGSYGVLSFSPLLAERREQLHEYQRNQSERDKSSVSPKSVLQYLVTSDTVDIPMPFSPDDHSHFAEGQREIDARYVKAAVELNKEIRPASASEYPVKNLHIENVVLYLTLGTEAKEGFFDQGLSGGVFPAGLLLYGAGSVVRNSVIEVRQGSAIWIYGPNALLENNTIIVHGEERYGRLREADAAIRLIQADGSVVRNNRIVIVRSATPKPITLVDTMVQENGSVVHKNRTVMVSGANPRAISLFDTGKIKVEGNTFYGIDRKEQIAEAFIGTVDMEESGSKFEPLDKAPLNAKNDKRSGAWWCKSGSFACPP